jgi:hypothetical protein
LYAEETGEGSLPILILTFFHINTDILENVKGVYIISTPESQLSDKVFSIIFSVSDNDKSLHNNSWFSN